MGISRTDVTQQGTRTRDRVYDYIMQYMMENDYPPTVREICAGVGLSSTTTVKRHLEKLEDDGRIVCCENTPRSIRIPGVHYQQMEVVE